jgi:hypothetical protein
MDPVSLVVGALAAGAGAGISETATTAVKDAYTSLKGLVSGWFKNQPAAELALQEHEADPATWEAPLAKALKESGAANDQAVIVAAQKVLTLVDAPGARSGKYVVDVRDSQGTVIGDHAHVRQTFGTPPRQ